MEVRSRRKRQGTSRAMNLHGLRAMPRRLLYALTQAGRDEAYRKPVAEELATRALIVPFEYIDLLTDQTYGGRR